MNGYQLPKKDPVPLR